MVATSSVVIIGESLPYGLKRDGCGQWGGAHEAHRPARTVCHNSGILSAMGKYVLAWFPMVAIAIANGVLRQTWYGKHLGELQAHQISTLTGVVLFGVYIGFIVRITSTF